jgi:hypothetical protein
MSLRDWLNDCGRTLIDAADGNGFEDPDDDDVEEWEVSDDPDGD